MDLFTAEQRAKLLENGRASAADPEGSCDHAPVVKLFNPVGSGTWLVSELDPENPDIAFGLCDLGVGCPEMGYVSIAELRELKLPFGLGIERDIAFAATEPLTRYAELANAAGGIISDLQEV